MLVKRPVQIEALEVKGPSTLSTLNCPNFLLVECLIPCNRHHP